MVLTLSFNITVSRVILQHWRWQSVGYGPIKDVNNYFRTSNLICSAASALPLCLDGWRSEIPLPHFCSALTAKDMMFRCRTSDLPWLPKIWSSASALSLLRKIWSSTPALSFCIDCQKCEVQLPHFRSALMPNMWSSASALPFCLDQRFAV